MGTAQVALTLTAVAASGCATHPPITQPPAARSCVYLAEDTGARYSLAYAGHRCSRPGYSALPEAEFDTVHDWCINASDTVAPIHPYRIRARLATLDQRSRRGFSTHLGGFWSQYKWAHHANMAHAGLVSSLGRTGLVVEQFEDPLRRLGFVDEDVGSFAIESRPLSSAERDQLVAFFAETETRLAADSRMLTPRRTVDEFLRAEPGYERRPIVRFRIDP